MLPAFQSLSDKTSSPTEKKDNIKQNLTPETLNKI